MSAEEAAYVPVMVLAAAIAAWAVLLFSCLDMAMRGRTWKVRLTGWILAYASWGLIIWVLTK